MIGRRPIGSGVGESNSITPSRCTTTLLSCTQEYLVSTNKRAVSWLGREMEIDLREVIGGVDAI